MSDVRLIDANALLEYFERLARSLANARCFNAADAVKGAAEKVSSAPTIDAVEVVRCRECNNTKWWPMPNDTIFCDKWDGWMPCNGFCHMGKKMDGGAE